MKNLIMMIILFGLSYSISYSEDCGFDDCWLSASGSASQLTIVIPNTTLPCKIILDYEWEIRNCSDGPKYIIRITSWAYVIDQQCVHLQSPTVMLETAYALLISNPALSPFPPESPNNCYDNYYAEHAGCWQWIDADFGPNGEMTRYLYACDDGLMCCKQYTKCIGNDYDDITITTGPYMPVACEGVEGDDEISMGCHTVCE